MTENRDARLSPPLRDLVVAELLRRENKTWPARVRVDLTHAQLGMLYMDFDASTNPADEVHFVLGPGRIARRATLRAFLHAWTSILRRAACRPVVLASLAPLILFAPLHLPLYLAGGAVLSRMEPPGDGSTLKWSRLPKFLLLAAASVLLVLPSLLLAIPAVAAHNLLAPHGGSEGKSEDDSGGESDLLVVEVGKPSAHEALESVLREERTGGGAEKALRALFGRFRR